MCLSLSVIPYFFWSPLRPITSFFPPSSFPSRQILLICQLLAGGRSEVTLKEENLDDEAHAFAMRAAVGDMLKADAFRYFAVHDLWDLVWQPQLGRGQNAPRTPEPHRGPNNLDPALERKGMGAVIAEEHRLGNAPASLSTADVIVTNSAVVARSKTTKASLSPIPRRMPAARALDDSELGVESHDEERRKTDTNMARTLPGFSSTNCCILPASSCQKRRSSNRRRRAQQMRAARGKARVLSC